MGAQNTAAERQPLHSSSRDERWWPVSFVFGNRQAYRRVESQSADKFGMACLTNKNGPEIAFRAV
jgi:hypothetical protein